MGFSWLACSGCSWTSWSLNPHPISLSPPLCRWADGHLFPYPPGHFRPGLALLTENRHRGAVPSGNPRTGAPPTCLSSGTKGRRPFLCTPLCVLGRGAGAGGSGRSRKKLIQGGHNMGPLRPQDASHLGHRATVPSNCFADPPGLGVNPRTLVSIRGDMYSLIAIPHTSPEGGVLAAGSSSRGMFFLTWQVSCLRPWSARCHSSPEALPQAAWFPQLSNPSRTVDST